MSEDVSATRRAMWIGGSVACICAATMPLLRGALNVGGLIGVGAHFASVALWPAYLLFDNARGAAPIIVLLDVVAIASNALLYALASKAWFHTGNSRGLWRRACIAAGVAWAGVLLWFFLVA
jgi:hypothetical protein